MGKPRTAYLHIKLEGMVERFNRTIEEFLRKVVEDKQQEWEKPLPLFLMDYRSDWRLPIDLGFEVSFHVDHSKVLGKQEQLDQTSDQTRNLRAKWNWYI